MHVLLGFFAAEFGDLVQNVADLERQHRYCYRKKNVENKTQQESILSFHGVLEELFPDRPGELFLLFLLLFFLLLGGFLFLFNVITEGGEGFFDHFGLVLDLNGQLSAEESGVQGAPLAAGLVSGEQLDTFLLYAHILFLLYGDYLSTDCIKISGN